MKKILQNTALISLAALALVGPVWSQTPLQIKGKKGDVITFPHGTASFADQVVNYQPGAPLPKKSAMDSSSILGVPDFKHDRGYVSLGKGGVVTVEFVDNRLIDVDGNDLYIFEIGPDVEAMSVEISEDGQRWISVGRVEGSTAYVDIGPYVNKDQVFRFVRLTDDPKDGDHGGGTPGADLDAVGAIGSVNAADVKPTPSANTGTNTNNSAGSHGTAVATTTQDNNQASEFFNAVLFYLPGQNQIDWGDTYPQRIIGRPDQQTMGGGSLVLGEGGSVVVGLMDHTAVNGHGSDLVVYGDLKGPLQVDVSLDGATWSTLGNVAPAAGRIDLGANRQARYVRLIDLNDNLWGSRIDSIGAVYVHPLAR